MFGNDFPLKAPFDPKKLTIHYGDFDGWEMVTSVLYDGEDIDNYNLDTTGKWGEAKWVIVGDEEVYEGEYRDDVDSDEDEESEEDDE